MSGISPIGHQGAPQNVEWRVIKRWEERFWISSDGDVWSSFSGRLMSQCVHPKTGHMSVVAKIKYVNVIILPHREVARAFIEDFKDPCRVHFKDHDKTNAKLSNLFVKPIGPPKKKMPIVEYRNKWNSRRQIVFDLHAEGKEVAEICALTGFTKGSVLGYLFRAGKCKKSKRDKAHIPADTVGITLPTLSFMR